MTSKRWLYALVVLLIASLACQAIGGGDTQDTQPTQAPVQEDSPATDTSDPQGSSEAEFPMPSDASNVVEAGGTLNFQTGLSLEESVEFYRDAFKAQGLTEREITTVIEDSVFSLVFDGHSSGQAIVVQGVDLGGSTNINVRFEDV
jgi:hypothetical protein